MTATIYRLPPITFIVERWNPHFGRTGRLIHWMNRGMVLTILDGDTKTTTTLPRTALTIFARPTRVRSAFNPRRSLPPPPPARHDDDGDAPMAA